MKPSFLEEGEGVNPQEASSDNFTSNAEKTPQEAGILARRRGNSQKNPQSFI